MRHARLIAGCLLAAMGAVDARAAPLDIPVENLLGVATLYFRDFGKARAVLAENGEGDADLRIYVETQKYNPDSREMNLVFTKKAVAFAGPMAGQDATIEVSNQGSLLIKSQNYAIGRTKWEKTLTVTRRDGDFLIIGITYREADGLNPSGGGDCDLNLVTGKGKRKGKPVTTKTGPIKLADWSDEKMPRECSFPTQ